MGIYKVNNDSKGVRTHVVRGDCPICGGEVMYWLDDCKGALEPMLQVGLGEYQRGQKCDSCSHVVNMKPMRHYNIFEN